MNGGFPSDYLGDVEGFECGMLLGVEKGLKGRIHAGVTKALEVIRTGAVTSGTIVWGDEADPSIGVDLCSDDEGPEFGDFVWGVRVGKYLDMDNTTVGSGSVGDGELRHFGHIPSE